MQLNQIPSSLIGTSQLSSQDPMSDWDAIIKLNTLFHGVTSPDEIITSTLDYLVTQFDLNGATVILFNPKTNTIHASSARGVFTDEAFSRKIYVHSQDIWTSRITPGVRTFKQTTNPLSLFIGYVPLTSQEADTGLLWFGRFIDFSASEISQIMAIAKIAAMAINNIVLFHQIQQQLTRISALREIDSVINQNEDFNNILTLILRQTIDQLSVDAADVLILDTQSNTLKYLDGIGFIASSYKNASFKLEECYAGQAISSKSTTHLTNMDYFWCGYSNLSYKTSFTDYCATPLIVKGQIKGVLEVFNRTPLDYDGEWITYFETLAVQAATALNNSDLVHELQNSKEELLQAYEATIEGWSKAVDLRDKETEGHSQRVTELTLKLAKAMNVKEEELLHIRRGALLHDIGKLGVPDYILTKPGALSDDEWMIMRKHPTYAFIMLESIEYLRSAIDIPFCHHERWDGTGYPRGLKGEQIPFAARIFALIDVWDALTTERPYRSAWSKDKAKEYIALESGKQFDPQVVEAFLRLFNSY